MNAEVIGHVDNVLRHIVRPRGAPVDVPFGGIPVLFGGGNWQKKPPGGTPAYRAMVERACRPAVVAASKDGPCSSSWVGLDRLAAAQRHELTRLMRSKACRI